MVETLRKATVLAALRRRGLDARADWVDRQLPDVIDVRRNASLLDTLGLDAADLVEEPAKSTPGQ